MERVNPSTNVSRRSTRARYTQVTPFRVHSDDDYCFWLNNLVSWLRLGERVSKETSRHANESAHKCSTGREKFSGRLRTRCERQRMCLIPSVNFSVAVMDRFSNSKAGALRSDDRSWRKLSPEPPLAHAARPERLLSHLASLRQHSHFVSDERLSLLLSSFCRWNEICWAIETSQSPTLREFNKHFNKLSFSRPLI